VLAHVLEDERQVGMDDSRIVLPPVPAGDQSEAVAAGAAPLAVDLPRPVPPEEETLAEVSTDLAVPAATGRRQ
jgi:hypothetical protein